MPRKYTSPQELGTGLRQIEEAWPPPTPETELRCVRLLVQQDAEDLLGVLGLTNHETALYEIRRVVKGVKVPTQAKTVVYA